MNDGPSKYFGTTAMRVIKGDVETLRKWFEFWPHGKVEVYQFNAQSYWPHNEQDPAQTWSRVPIGDCGGGGDYRYTFYDLTIIDTLVKEGFLVKVDAPKAGPQMKGRWIRA